jgi:predicted outer membrane protein
MRYLSSTLIVATVAGSMALLCGFRGQAPQDPSKTAAATLVRERGITDSEDGLLAFWLSVDSKNVVTLSRLAQTRATDSEVKRFAATMLTEHEQLLEKLRPFAKDADSTGKDGSNAGRDANGRDANGRDANGRDANGRDANGRDANGRDSNARDTSRALPAGNARGDAYPHSKLLQELGDQCLASTQAELEQKNGPQFDRCFMSMAVASQMHGHDKLTVFERHVSGDFKNVVVEAKQSARMHLDEAKLLLTKLESKELRVATPTREAK